MQSFLTGVLFQKIFIQEMQPLFKHKIIWWNIDINPLTP